MADPATLAMVSMGTTALGSLVKAGGSLMSGFGQSSMYKYQAGVAKVNQQIALQNANCSRAIGEIKAEESGMKSRAQAGQIKAAQGASGLRISGGSATNVRESQAQIGRYEQGIIRSNAAKAAYGHEVEALNFGAQSKEYSMASKYSKTSGAINAFSSLLGGASSVADKWFQFNTTFPDTASA